MPRVTARSEAGMVLFIVGMRLNKLWAVHKWLPVMIAMPKMLVEQLKDPSIGMLGKPRTFLSGRLIQVHQYWKSYDQLERYASDSDRAHFPAWKAFNRAARGNAAVGIYHETYVIGENENIYVNVPAPILLGAAVGVTEISKGRDASRDRLTNS